MPLPRAWKQPLRAMPKAARGKLQLMVRSAARPMIRKVSLGLNMPISRSGANWKARKPASIRHTAAVQAIFRVLVILRGFRAP